MDNNQPTIQQPTQQLDPSVVALAQSISKAETNGQSSPYTAKGLSGEFGAYQYTPNTWSGDSQKYLGQNVPLQSATPAQQDEVAYNKIKSLGQKGYNPAQIASIWNSNNPDPTDNIGVNDKGVSYDTPQYVQNVEKNYNQITGGESSDTSVPSVDNISQTASDGGKPLSGWEKFGLGATALGLGIAGVVGAPETGGASLEVEPEAGALGAETIGGAGATTEGAATEGATKTGTDILSKIGGVAKTALAGEGINAGVNAIKGVLGMNNGSSTDTSSSSSPTYTADLGQATSNSNSLSQTLVNALNQTASGSKLANTADGKEGIQTLSVNGLVPETDENGRLNSVPAIEEANKKSSELDDYENQLHDAEDSTGSISDTTKTAKELVRQKLPSTEWAEADKVIDADAAGYTERMGGDTVPLGSKGIGMIRKDGYKAFDRNSSAAKNAARKAMGSAANAQMKKRGKHPELIEGLHKEKQKLIHAKKVLVHLNGKKAPESKSKFAKFLKYSGEKLGIVIGDKIGGGLGAVIGSMIGHQLVSAVDKKYGKSEFESPAIRKGLEILQKSHPKVYGQVKEQLKKYEVDVQEAKKQEDIKQSKETRMSQKREQYKKKKGLINPPEKKNPYISLSQLPTIQMGNVPKKKSTLPVIR